MLLNKIKFITLCILLTVLASCSSDDSSDDELEATITNALLNGTWQRVCTSDGLSTSYDATIVLDDGNGNIVTTIYSDATCTTVSMIDLDLDFTYSFSNEVTLDGSVAGITSASEIDIVFAGGSPSFDIVAVKDLISLYFGDTDSNPSFDGSSKSKRAVDLDPTPYIKQ